MIRVLFMGRKAEGAKALEWCLNTGVDVVGVLTDSHLPGSPTKDVAEKAGVPVMTYDEAAARVANGSLAFDLGLSFVYWVIIKEPILSAARLGIINFHPAPLPDLKGTGGYNVAILQGRKSYGVSAHYVDAGIDTGGIIDITEFAVDPSLATAQTLERQSMALMLELFRTTVTRALAADEQLPTKPNVGGVYITRDEMESMKRIVSGDNPDQKARAFWFPPYLGAYVEVNDRKMTVVPESVLRDLAKGTTHLFSS